MAAFDWSLKIKMRILLIIVIIFTAACSSRVSDNMSEIELYKLAQQELERGNYTNAITNLKNLEARYPFGRFAEQSQLELLYAYFKSSEFEQIKTTSERFMRLYPRSNNLDYVLYVKAMTAFEQDRSFLTRYLPLSVSERDSSSLSNAFAQFNELVRRFPDSRFAPDAKQRMIYLRNLLAEREVVVAQYYLKRGAYVAAANRGKYVVENFQGTKAVKDGLLVMIAAYQKLDLPELAQNSRQIFDLNYAK